MKFIKITVILVLVISDISAQNNIPDDSLRNNRGELEFRGKIFSDFVGIADDQPNGLIQTNFYFSYKRPYKKNPTTFFRNIVFADVTFSKLENRNRELPVRYNQSSNPDSIVGYLNRLDLLHYSHLMVTLKLNILTIEYLDAFRFYVDYLGSFYRTAILDTLGLSNTNNVLSIAHGFNVKMKTNMDKKSNLAADLSYSHFWPRLFTSAYQEMAGSQYHEYNGVILPNMIQEEITGIDIIDLTIRHQGDNSDQFLRVALFGNYFSRKGSTPNIFYQFQIGIGIKLSKILNNNEEKNNVNSQN